MTSRRLDRRGHLVLRSARLHAPVSGHHAARADRLAERLFRGDRPSDRRARRRDPEVHRRRDPRRLAGVGGAPSRGHVSRGAGGRQGGQCRARRAQCAAWRKWFARAAARHRPARGQRAIRQHRHRRPARLHGHRSGRQHRVTARGRVRQAFAPGRRVRRVRRVRRRGAGNARHHRRSPLSHGLYATDFHAGSRHSEHVPGG